jgi:cytochrome c553
LLAGAALVASGLCSPSNAQAPQPPLIAQGCVGCHGQAGAGSGTVPRIAGYDRELFVQQFAAFRAKQRPATIMDRVASGYTDAEVAVLADYFSKLKPMAAAAKKKASIGAPKMAASARASTFKASPRATRLKSRKAAKRKPIARASFGCDWRADAGRTSSVPRVARFRSQRQASLMGRLAGYFSTLK